MIEIKTNEIIENACDETKTNDLNIDNEQDVTTQNLTVKNIPDEILKELIAKFSIDEEVNSDEELLLHIPKIEKAFYSYYDTYIFDKKKTQCTNSDFRVFARIIFQVVPSLQKYGNIFENIISQWKEYTRNIPRYGALILCDKGTHVLMVKSIQNYYNSWGFPRGKVELGEDPVRCAVREVYEEIGFDIGKYIKRDLYVENTSDKKVLRLYVIPNIPKSTKFEILSPMEIANWQWFKISKLSKNGTTPLVSKSCQQIIGNIRRYFTKSKSTKMQTIAFNLQKGKRKRNPPPPQSRPFPHRSNFPHQGNFFPNNGPLGNFPHPSHFVRPNPNHFRPDNQNNFRPNFNMPQQYLPPRNMRPPPRGIPPQRGPRPLLHAPNVPQHNIYHYGMMTPEGFLQNQFQPNNDPRRNFQRGPPMPHVF